MFEGFDGQSAYLRWSPKIYLACAAAVLASRWNHSIQFASLFAFVAWVHGRWLPYRFVVADEGLALLFPFGRRLFLPKSAVRIRLEVVGATALTGTRKRFGYPIFDHVLYHPDSVLADAFIERGYDIMYP